VINVEVTENVWKKAKKLHLERKLKKQIGYLVSNPRHHSLRFKRYVALSGKEIWKFEIDLNWWALTIKPSDNTISVYTIIHHP
jgi:hypothetical protein